MDDPDETDFLMGNLKINPGRKPITKLNNNNLKLKPLITKNNNSGGDSDSPAPPIAKPLNGTRTLPNPLKKRTTMTQKLAAVAIRPKTNPTTTEKPSSAYKSPTSSANSSKVIYCSSIIFEF